MRVDGGERRGALFQRALELVGDVRGVVVAGHDELVDVVDADAGPVDPGSPAQHVVRPEELGRRLDIGPDGINGSA